MKKFTLLLIIVLVASMLTGCMQIDTRQRSHDPENWVNPVIPDEPSSVPENTSEPVVATSTHTDETTEPTETGNKPSGLTLHGWQHDMCTMIDYTFQYMPNDISGYIFPDLLNDIKIGKAAENAERYNISKEEFLENYQTLLLSEHFMPLLYCSVYQTNAGHLVFAPTKEQHDTIMSLSKWADDVIKELEITNQTTMYQACVRINRYLCDYLTYDHAGHNNDVATAVKSHQCVCLAYAGFFQMLCYKCGIPCYIIIVNEISHAYNYIVFPSGETKYVDVTWNDSTSSLKYFMNNEAEAFDLHNQDPPIKVDVQFSID